MNLNFDDAPSTYYRDAFPDDKNLSDAGLIRESPDHYDTYSYPRLWEEFLREVTPSIGLILIYLKNAQRLGNGAVTLNNQIPATICTYLLGNDRFEDIPRILETTPSKQKVLDWTLGRMVDAAVWFSDESKYLEKLKYIISLGADPYSIHNEYFLEAGPEIRRLLDPNNTRDERLWLPTAYIYAKTRGEEYVLLYQQGIDLIKEAHKDGPDGRIAIRQDTTSIFVGSWDSAHYASHPTDPEHIWVWVPELQILKTLIPKDYVRALPFLRIKGY